MTLDRPTLSSRLVHKAIVNPPMLYSAWKPDIRNRLLRASITTACAFIPTSTAPNAAPKMNNRIVSHNGEGARLSSGSAVQNTSPAPISTVRLPYFAISGPVNGIASTPPVPEAINIRPRVPSPRLNRILANGTAIAQAEMPMPAIK